MGPIPFAFSVHNFVNSVGAYAGFASIIGLAILVLLYFAQARETASLREHAYEAAQRIQQLEARLAQAARRAPQEAAQPGAAAQTSGAPAVARPAAVGAVAAAGAGAAVAARPVAAPALAGAPAGVGAPALSAATRLIPVAAVNHGAHETGSGPAVAAPHPAAVAAPPPATVAGGANGSSRGQSSPAPVGAGAIQAPPRQTGGQGGNGAQRRPLPPPARSGGSSTGTSTTRKVLAVVITILGLAAVVVALLLLTSNNNTPSSSNRANAASNAPQRANKSSARTVAFNPATVNVAVLNGTALAGLAHRVSVVLDGHGFKQGAVATAADQTRTATVVGYMPGKRAQGLAVAHVLKLGPAVVQPVDPSTRAVACPPPTPCPSAVIVTVGSDLQNTP